MKRHASHIALGMFAALALGSAAEAHHGYAQYDRCAPVTIEGDINAVEWVNPHIILSVKTAETTYRIEWFALQQLPRVGLETGVLKTGDHVLITGSRNRDPQQNVMTLLTQISRPSDGWAWSRPKSDVCRAADAPAAGQ